MKRIQFRVWDQEFPDKPWLIKSMGEIEVIGNIHENPDLILNKIV